MSIYACIFYLGGQLGHAHMQRKVRRFIYTYIEHPSKWKFQHPDFNLSSKGTKYPLYAYKLKDEAVAI